MTFNDYQQEAIKTAEYPDKGHNLIYPALGLAGEAGETVDKIKKLWRNKGYTSGQDLWPDQRNELAKEIGDVLWYCAALAEELGVTLEHIAEINLRKLADRHSRGVIKSEGDNR